MTVQPLPNSDLPMAIPGPSMPPLLQIFNWMGRPLDWLDDCAQTYGDRFLLKLGGLPPMVFFSHPDAVQAILKAEPGTFRTGENNGILRPVVGNESVILLDGDRHQRQRQLLSPPFHGDRMKAYGDLICEITRQIAERWPLQQPIALRPDMQELSLQVILQAVFGLNELSGNLTDSSETQARIQTIKQLMRSILDATGSPVSSALLFIRAFQQDWGPWSPWGRFVRQRQQLDDLLYAEIGDRRAHPDPSRQDILTLLLSARDDQGEGMSDVEIRDELMTLLLAGHETTASALTWALYWIHRNPAIQQRLRAEVQPLMSSTSPSPDLGAIARLPYLNAVCQEALRLYPVAPIVFPRTLTRPLNIQGQTYPAGTMVTACIYLLHRNPDLYPDPTAFQPERFLNRTFTPYEFIPFGGGNRRCIGMAFALYEMKLVLATLLSHWQLQLVSDRPVKPQRRGVTLAPPDTLQVQVYLL